MAKNLSNGMIIAAVNWAVIVLHHLSLVELFKLITRKSSAFLAQKSDSETLRAGSNIGVDLFIVFKWLMLGYLLLCEISTIWAFWIAVYLIFFNLFSYFYYHAWGSDFATSELSVEAKIERERRRMINFILAIGFSILGFAYLFWVQFSTNFIWPDNAYWLDAVFFSASNSFTLTYGEFAPKNALGRGLLVVQVINMFVFVTILIANSLPNLSTRDGASE